MVVSLGPRVTKAPPHVLFTAIPEVVDRILRAAKFHRVGLINNQRDAEALMDFLIPLNGNSSAYPGA